MKKYLFIAEKPSLMRAAKDAYIKNVSTIKSSVGEIEFIALSGHVCGYAMPSSYPGWDGKWQDIDLPMIPTTFKIIPNSDKRKMISDIKTKLKEGYDGIIVGTDADVEGNGIYYLLEQHLGLSKYEALRFFEHDLTEKALLASFLSMTDFHKEPRDVHMTEAFLIRSQMDWLSGMNFSTGFSVKSGFTMRVGRVKAPTLKLVYDNSKAIDEFVPHTDYVLNAIYKKIGENPVFSGTYIGDDNKEIRFETKEAAEKFAKELGKIAIVKSMETKTVKANAPQLYKLSDVQVDAGKQFGYDPNKTMELVQSLYENHKIVSYPRTDGRYISSEKAKELPDLLKAVAGIPELKSFVDKVSSADITKVQSDKRVVNDAEVKKSSHDALLPTGVIPNISKLTKDELNVCTLIYKKLLALFMPQLEEEKTVLITEIDGNKFKTNAKITTKKGFTELYDRKSDDLKLPDLKKGDKIDVDKFDAAEKTTTAPTRLTQATLIAAMENIAKYIEDKGLKSIMKEVKGIGMPSSRGKIIKDLLDAKYMEEKGKAKGLYITELGKKYIENLLNFSIIKPELTAIWETKMQDIKEGSAKYSTIHDEMIQYIKDMVKEIEAAPIVSAAVYKSTTEYVCPICGKPIVNGKYGMYCPECKFSVPQELCSKKLSVANTKDLLTKGKTTEIKGFKSKAGKVFNACLKVNKTTKKVEFDFGAPSTTAPDEGKELSITCPHCGKPIIKGKWGWECSDKSSGKCNFSLSYKVAGREMKESELTELCMEHTTKKLSGFTSKAGKKFDAKMIVKADGTTGFEF